MDRGSCSRARRRRTSCSSARCRRIASPFLGPSKCPASSSTACDLNPPSQLMAQVGTLTLVTAEHATLTILDASCLLAFVDEMGDEEFSDPQPPVVQRYRLTAPGP